MNAIVRELHAAARRCVRATDTLRMVEQRGRAVLDGFSAYLNLIEAAPAEELSVTSVPPLLRVREQSSGVTQAR